MMSFFSPDRLARRSANHPWLTLGVWVLVVVAGFAAATQITFTPGFEVRGSDSVKAEHVLEDDILGKSPAAETVVVQSSTLTVDDPEFAAFVETLTHDLRGLDATVGSVTNYYELNDDSLVSDDRRTTILPVSLKSDVTDAVEKVGPMLDVLATRENSGFTVVSAGDGSIWHDAQHQYEKDLAAGEAIGVPVALVILVVVFGAVAAAGVPIILAILGIGVAMGVTALLSHVFSIDSMTVNMISMIGLAVGIDYTLFIVERFREERLRGVAKVEAVVIAGSTASRAVLFSGITVIIALAGLIIVPTIIMTSLAIGAITVVIAAVALALTLLPAVLSLLGDRINWLTIPGRKQKQLDNETAGFFGKTTAIVMRHPWVSAGLSAALLVAMAIPYLRIDIGSTGISTFPQDLQSVQAFNILDQEFSAGRIDPVDVVIDGRANSPEVEGSFSRLRAIVAKDPAFADTTELQLGPDGTAGYVSLFLNGDASSPEAMSALRRLRSDYVPEAFGSRAGDVLVGGGTASTVDYIDTMNTYLPVVIGFVLALSFVLLLLVFRSIVIPVKAIVMNLLSVGAAYGLIVLVFQEGVGAGMFGFHQSDQIEAWLPVFLFAVLFGLSMDYHVFLLSRIQETFLATGDNHFAVSHGLRSTAHIITGAAAIMMVVFGGFAMGEMVALQQMGFGLAVAVFLDATVVRTVLVPASMELLGAANWYLPGWLEWLPQIRVEGHTPVAAGEPVAAFDYAPGIAGGR
ncbi:MAG: MMPL family transporter [Tepidiformaceae bacterium]